MPVWEGLVRGVSNVLLSLGWAVVIFLIGGLFLQIVLIRLGRMRFLDAAPIAQQLYCILFDDDDNGNW